MQPVWRNRVRVGVGAYLVGMLLNSGLLWDVEHFIAFVLGVFAGPFLAGRRAARARRSTSTGAPSGRSSR